MNDKEILCFGDSFINLFNLIKDKKIYVKKIKGKTMKGISKLTDNDSIIIKKIINKYKNTVKAIILCFGSVDIHFSSYYNIYMNKYFDYKTIIDNYIKFIKSLTINKNIKIFILNPFINPVSPANYFNQLINYKIVENTEQNYKKLQPYLNKKFTLETYYNFTKYLNYSIKQLNNDNIINFNINNLLIDKNNNILQKYKDYSPYNIHLLYEPLLKLYLKFLFKKELNIQYTKKQINYFLKNEKKYMKKKIKDINTVKKNIINKSNKSKTKKLKKHKNIKT